jgi:hypothetical protein
MPSASCENVLEKDVRSAEDTSLECNLRLHILRIGPVNLLCFQWHVS